MQAEDATVFVFGNVQVNVKLTDAITFVVKDDTGVSCYNEVFGNRSC